MRISMLILLAFAATASPSAGQSFDRPVNEIRTNKKGGYFAGFMHWATIQTPFLAPVELAILGTVINIDALPNEPDEASCWTELEIEEILVCPTRLIDAASRLRYLSTNNCGSYAIGDSVLVFMIRYEGDFAIPHWRGTNTPIGHKLDSATMVPFCDAHSLIELIRSGHAWDIDSLSPEELRQWRCIDSEGILEALIRAREEEGFK